MFVAWENRTHLKLLLDDLYFSRSPLVRELCLIAAKGGWQADDATLQDIAFDLFCGRGNTKEVLEDTFQHQRLHEQASVSKKLSAHRFYYNAWHAPKLLAASSNTEEAYKMVRVIDEDRAAPLPTAIRELTSATGMYTVKRDHAIGLDEDQLVHKSKDSQAWRPGGPAALRRMVCATHFVRQDVENRFSLAAHAWACQLVVAGLVYIQATTRTHFLCLGSDKWMWYGYALRKIDTLEGTFFVLPREGEPIQFLKMCSPRTSFYGIPVELLYPSALPVAFRDLGIAFLMTSNNMEPIAKFGIRHHAKYPKEVLQRLCTEYGVVVPCVRGKARTLRDYADALVKVMFREESPETQQAFIETQCRGAKQNIVGSTTNLGEVFKLMRDDKDNWTDFKQLSSEVEGQLLSEMCYIVFQSATRNPTGGSDHIPPRIKKCLTQPAKPNLMRLAIQSFVISRP